MKTTTRFYTKIKEFFSKTKPRSIEGTFVLNKQCEMDNTDRRMDNLPIYPGKTISPVHEQLQAVFMLKHCGATGSCSIPIEPIYPYLLLERMTSN
ncbi:TPA: hypothetical protein QDB06_000779 [Burkholderia vietnamiensis]|nr:hypothetical protein [Burkholderia vietnamiensis]